MIALSGHAFTHFASTHPRHDRAKLKTGAMRTTRILELIGLQLPSPFSIVQAYSHIPQPMHLPGSTEINFLGCDFADIIATAPFLVLNYHCASFAFNRYLSKRAFLWKKYLEFFPAN